MAVITQSADSIEPTETTTQHAPLLSVSGLKQSFRSGGQRVQAVNGIDLHIRQGETYGLVGESGSGKSTIGRCLIRIYDPDEGRIMLDGREISGPLTRERKQYIASRMQMIFQDPMASLNPKKRVIDIIGQGLDIHRMYRSAEERRQRVYEVMDRVGLAHSHAERYPHQFSGGQRQRIGIARALIMNPKLLIADEAISALDVSIQAQIVNLLKQLQQELHMAYLFIAHDLAMVKHISDRIGVLHHGYLVETGTVDDIFRRAVHPYTRSLLSAIPVPDPRVEKNRHSFHYQGSALDDVDAVEHRLGGEHVVLATPQQLAQWQQEVNMR
ncbi:ATP-binding cassette domain-containing protein [Paenibacillus hunanensis]|uniref:ATP-binding cassette domain-containing protein n=1 Tax=Paenibacillus hunanensis TaxID=539262 RepID=UPI002026AF8E|nr:ATP-binding cassette domain-containing protein [Paenibacillus hunanensis]MCL9659526.1 ATP-binding cassette domain-containing protein [Paenibacillus hunanensis]